MKLNVDDELYELLMIDYQVTEVARLNDVLNRNGIDAPALRTRICAEFADASGSFLDSGWLEGEAPGRYWPEIVFSKRTVDPEEGLGDMEEIVVPEYGSNFHEYVSGAIVFYFEENSEAPGKIRTGSV